MILGLLASLLMLLVLIAGALHEPEGFRLALIMAAGALFTILVVVLTIELRARRRFQLRLSDLAHALALRERQIASILHDIRDPLSTLASMITLLSEPNLDEHLKTNLLTRIAASAAATDRQVKNALDLYLLDEQHLSARRRPIQIAPLIREIIERFAPEARLKQVTLEYQAEPLPPIEIDPLHFDRIVSNLLSNAIELAFPAVVSIKPLHDRHWLTLQIANHEAALASSELEHFFDRPEGAAEANANAALARFITKSLVELDGGVIRASSQNGNGLLLEVQLPLEPRAPAPP